MNNITVEKKSAIHRMLFLEDDEALIFSGYSDIEDLEKEASNFIVVKDKQGRWYRPSLENMLIGLNRKR